MLNIGGDHQKTFKQEKITIEKAVVEKSQKESQVVEEEQQDPLFKWCIMTWLIFFFVFAVYAAFWAIDRYIVQIQASGYYGVPYPVTSYISNSEQYSSSTEIFQESRLKRPEAIGFGLIFSWILWKFPLFCYIFQMVSDQPDKKLRYIPFIIVFLMYLISDTLFTIFFTQVGGQQLFSRANYIDWISYLLIMALSYIVVGFGNMGNNVQSALMTNTFVFTFLILMYSAYTILLPGLYYDFLTNFPEPASLLQIYMFPIFDLILYSILLYGNSKIDEKAKLFTSVFHFLQLGYLVGTCLLVGIAEVEFYYLLSYIGLRNLFTNRLMESWKSCVNNPICLSGWILFYLLSYVFNTVPIIGLGRIVISKSFFSQILSLTKPILHYYEPTQNLYHKTPIQDDIGSYNYNTDVEGHIFWGAALIIWFTTTMSHKYIVRRPSPFLFYFYMIGVYFFYIGLCSGLVIAQSAMYAFA